MKFIVLGKYTKQGTDGWLDNPDEDRRTMISGLSQKIGGKLLDLSYTRGIYDVVATVEAPSADIMTSLKLAMMKTGAIAELTILEDIDLNSIAKEGAKMIGLYKAPGNWFKELPNITEIDINSKTEWPSVSDKFVVRNLVVSS